MNFKHDMKKLFQTFWIDIKVQFRNGLYLAMLFVAVIWIVLATALPMNFKILWLPVIILLNQSINSFYFLGAMVLFEKKDGTVDALVVSPLRPHEYLISKAVTLTLLSSVESIAIVIFGFGININTLYIVLGAVSLSVIYSFLAFACVAPFDSITTFLFPSILIINIFQLNLIDYFGLMPSFGFYLFPTQSSLILLKAGFVAIPIGYVIYGIIGSIAWIGLSFWLAIYFFKRYVVKETGEK